MSPAGNGARVLLRWIPAVAIMLGIFVLSSISGLRISEDPGVDGPLRALSHLLVYALLAAALLFAVNVEEAPTADQAVLATALAILYAGTDEIHQAFVPWRTGRLDDIAIDAVGAVIGVGLGWWLLRRRRDVGIEPEVDG